MVQYLACVFGAVERRQCEKQDYIVLLNPRSAIVSMQGERAPPAHLLLKSRRYSEHRLRVLLAAGQAFHLANDLGMN